MTDWRSIAKLNAAVVAIGFSWCVAIPFQARAAAPWSGATGVDPVRVAHEVFQEHGFWWKRIEPPRAMSLNWLESFLTRTWDSIAQRLAEFAKAIARFLAWLFGVFRGGSSGADPIAVWLIIGGILAWSAWKLYPAVVRWLSRRMPVRVTQEGATWQPLAESSDLFEQAGQAFRDGLHAEAIRLALLALIARLEKQGLLRYDTTRTNREYQRELRHMSELAACFGQLARIYDRVWYGRAAAGRADAEQAIRLCGSVINREDLAPE